MTLRYLLAVGLSPNRRPGVLLKLRHLPKLAEWKTRVWRGAYFADDTQPTVVDVTAQVLTLFEALREVTQDAVARGEVARDEIDRLRLWVDPEADYRFSLTTQIAPAPSATAIAVGVHWYRELGWPWDVSVLDDLERRQAEWQSMSGRDVFCTLLRFGMIRRPNP